MPINYPDTIHGIVRIPDTYKSILESLPLTRLRNVKQLGFTSFSYPGAVHTRFEHTIGTIGVLSNILNQFRVKESEWQKYFTAAILSEIGIYPLSYTSRAIFLKYGFEKSIYAKLLYDNFLHAELKLSSEEYEFIFNNKGKNPEWFSIISNHKHFSYLDPVKLASTIDYVLRDSYYTGRYGNNFDYRFFLSLSADDFNRNTNELYSSLYTLHRAIHSLNVTYGDPLRRAVTLILIKLIDRLVENDFIKLDRLKDANFFVELDDDNFLYKIQSAVELAESKGDILPLKMYNLVSQRSAPRIEEIEINAESKLAEAELVKIFAEKHMIDPCNIFLLGQPYDKQIGYRMFGSEYHSYSEAVNSQEFRDRTGLQNDSNILTEGLNPNKVKALIL